MTTRSRKRSGKCSPCKASCWKAGRQGSERKLRRPAGRHPAQLGGGLGGAGRNLRYDRGGARRGVAGAGGRVGPGRASRRAGTARRGLRRRTPHQSSAAFATALRADRDHAGGAGGRGDVPRLSVEGGARHRRSDDSDQLRGGRCRAAHHRPPARLLGGPLHGAGSALARAHAQPAGQPADRHRQRGDTRAWVPGGSVRHPGGAARAGRPGRAARRRRARRTGDDPLGLLAGRHHRPRGDGAAHRDGLDRGEQNRRTGPRARAALRLLPHPGGRRKRRRRARGGLPQGHRPAGPGGQRRDDPGARC